MSYKGFTIVPQTVDLCIWDNSSNAFQITGKRTVYKIIDSASKLVYGMKHTLDSAKKLVDVNAKRWQISKPPVNLF